MSQEEKNKIKTFVEYISLVENTPIEEIKKEMKMIHRVLLSEGGKEWDGRHYGDCTKQNVSCLICLYHTWLDQYEEYTKEFYLFL